MHLNRLSRGGATRDADPLEHPLTISWLGTNHAFEEGFFFLDGQIEAELDGETYTLRTGDYCWSSVGGMHALHNHSDGLVRWLETQAPQPPSRYAARFTVPGGGVTAPRATRL